jgi:HSP20 family protein
MRSLVPKKKHEEDWTPAVWGDHPFGALHRQVDDLFDEFFTSFPGFHRQGWPGLMGHGVAEPQLEVSETDEEVKVKVELPGMDDKDIEVLLDDNVLTIRGEKKEEHKEEKENYHVSEVRYGRFSRTIPVPAGVDRDRVTSTFKKGVLRLAMPKTKEARENRRRIEISTEA